VWLLAGAGLVLMWFPRKTRRHWFLLLGLLVCSFVAMCPGFYFREHYFILIMPALAMLAGASMLAIQRFFSRNPVVAPLLSAGIFLGVYGYAVYQERIYLFTASPDYICKATYGANPFNESQAIADFVKKNCPENATVAILGSEPQIPFYAQRRSSTGYVYMYPLMEIQPYAKKMQLEVVEEITAAKPEFVIFVDVPTSWLVRQDSEPLLMSWFSEYQKINLQLVAGLVINPMGASEVVPQEQLGGDWRKGRPAVAIFKRQH
jgi:hypothetical protein